LGRPHARQLRAIFAASYQRAGIVSGLAATLLATALALPMAYAVARIEMPYRGLISAMTVVPLISPPFIGAYAWIILLGNNGTITQGVRGLTGWTLPTIYGPPGVILALALSYFPYVFLIVQGALPRPIAYRSSAQRASRAHPARITAPLPPGHGGDVIVFIKAIGDFGVPRPGRRVPGAAHHLLPVRLLQLKPRPPSPWSTCLSLVA
jgi:iron(III) transport system permease protein